MCICVAYALPICRKYAVAMYCLHERQNVPRTDDEMLGFHFQFEFQRTKHASYIFSITVMNGWPLCLHENMLELGIIAFPKKCQCYEWKQVKLYMVTSRSPSL